MREGGAAVDVGHAATRPEEVKRVDHHARVLAVRTCDDGEGLRQRGEPSKGHELEIDLHPELARKVAELGEPLHHDTVLVVATRDDARGAERSASLEYGPVALDLDIPCE